MKCLASPLPKTYDGASKFNKSSAVAEMDDRLATIDMGRKEASCCVPIAQLPAALRAAQTCRYLIYSEADFEVFRPAGATRCTDRG